MPDPETVQAATTELDRVRREWLARPGVTGVDVGFDPAGEIDQVAIRVYVERKLPRTELPPHEIFPQRLGPFPVRVIEASFGPEREGHAS